MKIDNVGNYRSINEFILKTGGIYCGRPSVLGNPFPMRKVEDRDEVIEQYRKWLWEQIQTKNKEVMDKLNQMNKDTVLGCWCSPKRCHLEVIIKAWNWLNKENASITYVEDTNENKPVN